MNALEGKVREFCAGCLDPLVGADTFDFVTDLGAEMPMRVIGMLLGIPDADQTTVRDKSDAFLRTEAGKPMELQQDAIANGEMFAEYVDWRAKHPSDDLMTALLNAEFEDETGTTRTLSRDEVLTYTQVLAGAGNETTGRLIGWLGKVLGEHPDQRRELVADRSLIPNAIEETLRFEPTGPHIARYVARDVEYYGQTVPAGSAMLLLVGSANRDERRYDDPDRFDIHRDIGQHLTFGYGLHFCLGAALARLEGRVALDEVLDPLPRLGGRPRQRQAGTHLHGARLGHHARLRRLTAGSPSYRARQRSTSAPGLGVPGGHAERLLENEDLRDARDEDARRPPAGGLRCRAGGARGRRPRPRSAAAGTARRMSRAPLGWPCGGSPARRTPSSARCPSDRC